MYKFIAMALLCPCFSALAAPRFPEAAPAAARSAGTPGAYNPVPTDAPMVLAAKSFVQERFPMMFLQEVEEAFIQVEAGYNVKFRCRVVMEEGPVQWQFIAFQSPEGAWRLVSAQRC